MIVITLDNVSVTYISQPIFYGLSWEIHSDRTVGLVGTNGAGKSTLLKLIDGTLQSDSGFVVRHSNHRSGELKIGYLPQEPNFIAGYTVWQETLSANSALTTIDQALDQVETRLSDPDVYGNEGVLAQTLDEQAHLLEEYDKLGGPSYQGRVRSTLESLGFSTEADRRLSVDVLSGGQKKLVGLAKLLVTQPDVLLLDEPDNHLDLDGKMMLEELIRGFDGAVIIVSHDRYLLDMVVDEIAEIEDGRLTRYLGDYSEYAFEKQTALLRQQQLFQAQQKEITRLEQSAKRLLTWGRVYDNEKFIKRGQNILKRIERIDRIDKPILERKRMGLALSGWRGSNKVVEINDLYKIFASDAAPSDAKSPVGESEEKAEEKIVLAGLDLLVWRGERVGLVGPNGSGKSVLFRLLLGEEEATAGRISIGPSISIGYYAQEHETLDYGRTLIETVRHAAHIAESNAVSFLGNFLFTYEQARGPVSELSGGERSRLQMALLMLSNANFLLLDEPTNNLDIASAEVLEDALQEFDGTVLVISHDRYFLDRIVGRIVEIEEGALNEYTGGYSDYQSEKVKRAKIKKKRNRMRARADGR